LSAASIASKRSARAAQAGEFRRLTAATMSGRLEEVQAWFSKDDRKNLSNSRVEIRGNRMTYSNFQPEGAVDYAGRISGNRLDLDVFNHTNRRRVKAVYRFVKLHDLERDCRTPEPEGEFFGVFFSRFTHDKEFAISRTKSAVLEDFVPKQANPQITTLDAYIEKNGLVPKFHGPTDKAQVVSISDPDTNSHFAYFFGREEKCWILVQTGKLYYKP
jgi:hypothetical protein